MAFYKYSNYLASHADVAFDQVYPPGSPTPFSGIYRCEGCGHEITSIQDRPLPPQNHHEHNPSQGKIRWQLIVATTHQP
jgi:hypothetical protein